MKKTILTILTLVLVVSCSKNFDEYEHLVQPQISEKVPQKMLVYEAVGNPNETVGNAFGALFSTFFKLKKDHEMDMAAPLARWPKGPDVSMDEWVGIYAMPVAETVTEIPEKAQEEHPDLKLETWKYGLVAEILHKGSYASEGPTVEKLHKFITDSGYEISGLHEEEYLKGPGMFGPGNPDKYVTIIRYPVTRKMPGTIESNTVETKVVETDSTTAGGLK